jgi:DNA-directed RNA polymerase subunit H (RpoH/RPB5)
MEAESSKSNDYQDLQKMIYQFNEKDQRSEKRQLVDYVIVLMEIFNERRKAYKYIGLYDFLNENLITSMTNLVDSGQFDTHFQPLSNFFIQWEFSIDISTGSKQIEIQKLDSLNQIKNILLIKNNKSKKINNLNPDKKLYIINLDEWFYNPLSHVHQPNFYVLDSEKKSKLLEKYNIKESQIPKMDCGSRELDRKETGADKEPKGDIVGRYLGFLPSEIILIQKKTLMNGQQDYYRIVK